MTSEFQIYNSFGINPSKNYLAAGWDFYIPRIDKEPQYDKCYKGLNQSFKKKLVNIDKIHPLRYLKTILQEEIEKYFDTVNIFSRYDYLNITHLFLAIDSPSLKFNSVRELRKAIIVFIHDYLIVDNNNTPGIKIKNNDYLLFNSGIKVKLDEGTAGIFFNKSGKGNSGFDIRACVVDEDYTGFVHLSVAYEKSTPMSLYCGDKLSQMVILPIVKKDTLVELSESEYNELQSSSNRGSNAFGSSDIAH